MTEKPNPTSDPVAGKIGATTTRGGRPCKLTPELQAKLVEVIAAGGYYEIACRCVGIGYSTFRRWMQQGARENSGDFFDLFDAIKKAEAECEQDIVKGWKAAMPGNWQAAATFLERRHPERWSKDRLELKKLAKELQDMRKEVAEIMATSRGGRTGTA